MHYGHLLVPGQVEIFTIFTPLQHGSFLSISEEDTYGSYGRLLLKYFCAEAVMTGHSLLLSSLDYDSQQLLKVKLHFLWPKNVLVSPQTQ